MEYLNLKIAEISNLDSTMDKIVGESFEEMNLDTECFNGKHAPFFTGTLTIAFNCA